MQRMLLRLSCLTTTSLPTSDWTPAMPPLLLKISVVKRGVTKLLHFDKSMTVFDACRHIWAKLASSSQQESDTTYGLFLSNEDPTLGVWLENSRTLDYYKFKSAKTSLEYRSKQRLIRVCTLDGATRKVGIDDSLPALENIRAVCARIGIQNHQEFSFTVDTDSQKYTLKRADKPSADRKLDTLRKERHTHDFLHWVDPQKTLREQGLFGDSVELTLRKKYFFSDEDVGANDPVQLHLLYTQTSEAVTNGVHPVTMSEALSLSALRCQEVYGDYMEKKFQKGSIRSTLRGFLPVEYRKDTRKTKASFLLEYQKLAGFEELSAKFQYIEKCRKLDTYGTSFFAVKEKVPRRNKLHPVMLGIKRECVLTLDVKTKEVLDTWELKTIHSYFSTPTSFCLNFGGYRSGLYIVKTTEGESIVQLLDGYIQLIQQTMKSNSVLPSSSPIEKPLSPKEKMQQEISEVINKVSQSRITMEAPAESKIKKSKGVTIETSKLKLSALVSALLYSSAILWRETVSKSCDYIQISAAAYSLEPIVSALTDCSRLLASLGLTDKDGVRILGSAKALVDTIGRLLVLVKQDENVDDQVQATLEDVASRATDLLAIIDLKKGVSYGTYQSAAPVVLSVTSSVSSFLAETVRIKGTCGDETLEVEIMSNVKDVKLSCQVLATSFTLISSCSESPIGQSLLIESTQAVIESVHRLCFSSKGVCLDGDLIIEVGASASTVASNLNSLITKLGATSNELQRHPLEKSFTIVLAEARILKSLLTRKQPRRKVLTLTKSFMLKVAALIQSLKSYYTIKEFDRKRELLDSLKKLLDEISVLVEGVKDTSLSKISTDTLLSYLDESVSTVSVIVKPLLEKIRYTQFSNTVQTTFDSTLVLTVIVKNAAEHSEFKTVLLEHCKKVEAKLRAVKAAFGTENHIIIWTDIREIFPYLSSLCAYSRALTQELYLKKRYASEVILMWNSHVQSQLYELKSILSKMISYSGRSFGICSISLKTLRESVQHPLKSTDGLDALSYGQTCHTLAQSCSVFISLVSELDDRSSKHSTYTVLVSQTEKIVNSLLGLRRDEKESISIELAVRLLDEIEELGGELFNHSPLDLRLMNALRKTVFEIRDCLPLHQEFSTTLQKFEKFQAVLVDPTVSFSKPAEGIDLIDAIRSIHAAILVILDAPNTSLEEYKVSLTNFTSAVQSILSIGKEKASCLDDQHREDVLAKLKQFSRKSCKIIQTATRVCYQPRVCPLALAPAAKSLVSSLTDIALVLTSSGTEQKNEYDLALMELEALNAVFLTGSNVSLSYSTTSYSECYGAIVQQVKNIVDFTSDPKEKSLVQAVRNILDFAIQASGLCSQSCERGYDPYAHDYHMTVSQMMIWSAQFLDICEQLLDPSLNSTQRLTLEATVSMELRSMSGVIEYMASTLVGNIEKRKLLQCMESLAMRVSQYLEVVKESTFESIISSIISLVDIYVVMENVYSTTAAAALSVPNKAITVASSSVLSSAMTWLRTVQPPQEQTKPNEELAAFKENVQKLVTKVREIFIGRLDYARCLRQMNSFKVTLDAAVNETTKYSEGIVGLHTSVTKVRRSCYQMERKLKSIQSLPHVDCIGHQICETTIEMEALLESVVKTCTLTPKSENTLLLVQHSSTCLEALSDILQWLNDLACGDSEGNDIDLLKSKIQKLLCGLDDLISLTLAISTKGFNPVSIMEFKRAAKRDDIPPFVFEDTDSDIHIHVQLTAQCHLLTKALNSMDTEDTEGQMDLQLSVLLPYREISKVVCSIQGIGEEERECLLHSNQSLADTIAIVLQDIAILSLHPENIESRKSLKEAVKSAQEDVFRLVLLAQLDEDGAQWSAVDSLRSCVSNLDLYWVCSTYAQQSDIEQTDSQTRRLTSDNAQVLLEVVSNLVKVNEEEPDKLVSSVLLVSYTVSSIYESLEESYATMALSKYDLRIVTALRDISTILVDLLKMSSGTCLLTNGNITSSLKLAQQAAISLLETVKEDNQRATVVDTITATINHVDYLQTVTKAKFDSPLKVTYTDVVRLTTLLTLLAKRTRDTIESSGSIDEVVITECALLTRLTLTSLLSVSSQLISIVEDETEKTELVQGKCECISSIQFVLLQLKTKTVSPNEVSMEVVSSSMDRITSFSQELLEVFENIDDAVTGDGPFQLIDYFLRPWSDHHHITEDVDSPDSGSSHDIVIANTCGVLLQALQSLVTVPTGGIYGKTFDSLTPDKRFWVQSHIAMLSSLNLEVEGKAFNTHYLARMLLKMVADTLILWRVLYMPTNSDWLALVTSSKTLAQAIARM